jgi:outer membrane receptor protein involved in Fe transport
VTDINYRREFSNGLFGFAGVSANYRSETTAGFGDDPRLDIDAYTIVDARIGVGADDDWRLTAFVRNAGDEYYWTNVARLSDVFRRYAGQPRTWGVQLDLEF